MSILTLEEELTTVNPTPLLSIAIRNKFKQKILKTQISSQNLSKMLKACLLRKVPNSLQN